MNAYVSDSPGSIVRITSSGASAPAWKSIEWPIDPVVDQGDLEPVADRAAEHRAGRLAAEGPQPLRDPGATSRTTSWTAGQAVGVVPGGLDAGGRVRVVGHEAGVRARP